MPTVFGAGAGSNSAGFSLAPDLTWPFDVAGSIAYKALTLTLTPNTYNTALSLTGKFAVGLLHFQNLTNEATDIRLTIDDVLIWDGGRTTGTIYSLLGNSTNFRQYIRCESNLLLEIQTATDTSCLFIHDARPIL